MPMQKILISLTDEMVEALESERKARKLASIQEVIRQILSDYFKAEKREA